MEQGGKLRSTHVRVNLVEEEGMFRKSALMAILFLCTVAVVHATDIGNYRIPQPVQYAGTSVDAGVYTVQIVDGAEGPYLQLGKNDAVVAKDLAIVIPATSPGKTSVQIARIAGQEFVRIRVRYENNWYYAYMVSTH